MVPIERELNESFRGVRWGKRCALKALVKGYGISEMNYRLWFWPSCTERERERERDIQARDCVCVYIEKMR